MLKSMPPEEKGSNLIHCITGAQIRVRKEGGEVRKRELKGKNKGVRNEEAK